MNLEDNKLVLPLVLLVALVLFLLMPVFIILLIGICIGIIFNKQIHDIVSRLLEDLRK